MGSKEGRWVLLGSVCFRLAWVGHNRAGPGRAGVVVSSYYGYLGASFLSTIIFLISVNVSLCVCLCESVVRKSISVCCCCCCCVFNICLLLTALQFSHSVTL